MIEENEYEYEGEEVEDQEQDYGSDVETMLDAIRSKNLNQAKNHFENIIGDKVHDSLEAEKVRLANVVYNGSTEDESDYDEDETEIDDIPSEDAEWDDITAEIEDSLE